MSYLTSGIIKVTHLAVVIFITVTPFLKKLQWPLAVLHVTSVASLLVHWYVDQDTCFLTLLESMLLGINPKTSFMHRLVSPVYKIQDKDVRQIVWIVTPLLGLISVSRLWNARYLIKHEMHEMYNNICMKYNA